MTVSRPFSRWLDNDRPDETPIAWSGDRLWTLGQLRHDVTTLYTSLLAKPEKRWALCLDDSYRFLIALLATLYAGKTPILPGHARIAQLKEQRTLFDGVLSDRVLNWDGPFHVVTANNSTGVIPLPALPGHAMLELFTSGSTGYPKRISKSIATLDKESSLLAARFAGTLAHCRVVSSVSPQHLYGLTFRIFLPMALGLPLHAATLAWPEQLAALTAQQRYLFISSPSFLKHLDPRLTPPDVAMLVSAGGVLHWHDARRVRDWMNIWPDEIYGSTETGILAWRHRSEEDIPWQPFSGVTFTAEENAYRAISPLIEHPAGLLLDDELRFTPEGHFDLMGRRGRVIKIAEKRVSLQDIEHRLLALDGVRDAAALLITRGGRQNIAALLVLDDEQREAWQHASKRMMEQSWRRALRPWLEPVALPRYWRVIDEIPVNSMNKRIDAQLQEFFNDNDAR